MIDDLLVLKFVSIWPAVDGLDVALKYWLAGYGLSFRRYAFLGHGDACIAHVGDGVAIDVHVLHADGVVVVGHDVAHLHGVVLLGELDAECHLFIVALLLQCHALLG